MALDFFIKCNMRTKLLILELAFCFLIIITACKDNVGTDPTIEPINIQKSFNFSSNFSDRIKQHIIDDEAFNSGDIFLFSLISSDSVTNPFTPSPITYTRVAGYFERPSEFESVFFNNIKLILSVTFLTNIHFTIPVEWNFNQFQYGKEYEWLLVSKSKESSTSKISLSKTLHPAGFSAYEDTIGVDASFTVKWSNPTNTDKIFIDFSYYNNTDRFDYTGVSTNDTGSYLFEQGYLKNLGINRNGLLVLHLLRLKKDFFNISFSQSGILKAISYSMTEAKIAINVIVN